MTEQEILQITQPQATTAENNAKAYTDDKVAHASLTVNGIADPLVDPGTPTTYTKKDVFQDTDTTYTFYLDNTSNPIVVSMLEMDGGQIQLVFDPANGYWQKEKVPVDLTNHYTKEEIDNKKFIGGDIGKNLFDYNDPDIARGKYIAGDGGGAGSLSTNTSYSVTGYIPITAGQSITIYPTVISSPIGHNLYDADKVKLSTVNNTDTVTAAQDGYVRFTIQVAAAADITAAHVQAEDGTEATTYEPYAIYLSGDKLKPATITADRLDETGQAIFDGFEPQYVYDSLSALITGSGYSGRSQNDISGWGASFNATGISFNAIRVPAGATFSSVASNRRWKWAKIVVKNAYADSAFIAVSPLISVDGETTLPEIIYPLLDPDTGAFITLSDASFSGSTYWINIYYYNADMSYAYGGITYSGTISNYVAGTSRYTTTNSVASWLNFTGNPALTFEHLLLTNPSKRQHLKEIDELPALSVEVPEINLPDKITAIVGDTLQLFWRGCIKAVNPYIYDIVVNCTKGAWYPRYFEYTPTSGDVGTVNFELKIKNGNGVVLASKTITLETKNAVAQPSANKKILCIGDSLTNARVWPAEMLRRLTGSGGTPAGKGYSNIQMVGRKAFAGGAVEGNSGWTWPNFVDITPGMDRKAYTFTVTAPTVQPGIEAVYQDANGKQYTMWWDYSTTSLKFLVNDLVSTPPASGTLTKVSGIGDATITYSATVQSSGNPFKNDGTGALDITSYVNKWCGGSVDVIYIMMTWNGQTGNRTDFTSFTNYAKTLFAHIKTAYPSIQIKLMGVNVADLRGGVRVDGSPAENTYRDTYGLVVTALNMNTAYQALANEAPYNTYVEFLHVSSQVDSEFNMPYVTKAVNSRNSAANDFIGTNDVHPSNEGYLQIADVGYRNFTARYCQ